MLLPLVSSAVVESNGHLTGVIQANLMVHPQLAAQKPVAIKQTSDHRLTEMISRRKYLITAENNPTEMNAPLGRHEPFEAGPGAAKREAAVPSRAQKEVQTCKASATRKLLNSALRWPRGIKSK
jgi:hypothetical protein